MVRSALLPAVPLISLLLVIGHAAAQRPNVQRDMLWRVSTAGGFAAWTPNGVAVHGRGAAADVELSPALGRALRCRSVDIDGGHVSGPAGSGLCSGRDPVPAGRYPHAGSYYNGGSFHFGTLLSPVHPVPYPIDQLIASWDAVTPPGTWLQVHARLRVGGAWTGWYRLPIWASGAGTIHRHSVDHQPEVATDTVTLKPGRAATAYQLAVTLFIAAPDASPRLRLIAAIASHDAPSTPASLPDRSAWGIDLPVPQRSQMAAAYRGLAYGGGGEAWCSPTSTSMVLAYWTGVLHRPGLMQSVPAAAAGVYDATYDGTGNWPFNTAYAAELGLTAYVTRMPSMTALEEWIARRVPIVISVAFRRGELPGEPVGASDGHLMVVRGFTRSGDVVTNDPAASTDAGVRIVYPRTALERVWQEGSHGTAYVIYPAGWPGTR